MSSREWAKWLEELLVVALGHFVFRAGEHSPKMVNMEAAMVKPKPAAKMGRGLAYRLRQYNADCVLGIADGGITLAHRVADRLESLLGHEVPGLYASKTMSSTQFLDTLSTAF